LFLRILNRPDGFRAPGQPEDFVRGFQVFDKDGTGYIGVGELKYGMKLLSRIPLQNSLLLV
jgi:Ca2+-binding EF-hand superfamily protein